MTNLKNIMNEIFITKYYIIMGWNTLFAAAVLLWCEIYKPTVMCT